MPCSHIWGVLGSRIYLRIVISFHAGRITFMPKMSNEHRFARRFTASYLPFTTVGSSASHSFLYIIDAT